MGTETHVGTLLRAARKALFRRGLNWRRIEDDLLLAKSSVEHWEAGRVRKVPFAQVMALADYLGIPLEDLQAAALADASELRDAQRGRSALERREVDVDETAELEPRRRGAPPPDEKSRQPQPGKRP